jgi:prepilin-type N-terminal cleavage/methylation domain-containing protein
MPENRQSGFSLAELLIALAILGEIAAFAIPKILNSQQKQQMSSVGKEAIVTISQAYELYRLSNTVSSSTSMGDLTQYLNYVQLDTSSALIDHVPTLNSRTCNGTTYYCYRLASGAVVWHDTATHYFGGTNSTNAIEFFVDPDGVYGGSTSGNSKSAQLYLYYNGRLTSRKYINSGTVVGATSKNPDSSLEPVWLVW